LISAAAVLFGSSARADFILDLTPVGQSVNLDKGSFDPNAIFTGTSGSETIDFSANVAVDTASGTAAINAASAAIHALLITPEDGTAFNEFSFRGAVFTNANQTIKVTLTDQFNSDSVFQFLITDNGDFTRIGFEVKPGTGELIKSFNAEGMTVLVVEHDMAFVRQIAQRVTVLHFGEIFARGSLEAILKDEKVAEIYLGKTHAH